MMPIPFDDTGENWRQLDAEQFEACRHAREVNRCLREGYGWAMEHVRGVAVKRSHDAAAKIYRDIKANREAADLLSTDS